MIGEIESSQILLLPMAIAVACGALYVGYVKNSDLLLKFGLKIYREITGMRVKYVSRKGGKGTWCYAEKGHKKPHHSHHKHHSNHKHYPTLVFVHGFGADKDTWPSMIQFIPKKYHCIIVDLPGHGETDFVDGVDELNMEGYVKSLREFLEVTGIDHKPFYLIGCSFGGAVAGLFAYHYPELIHKLGLLCPAIKTPQETETYKQLINGNYEILIPKNGKQFVRMISLLANKRQPYPERIMQSFVNLNFTPERQDNLRKLLESMVIDEFQNFDKNFYKMQAIKSDTIIIWGEDDEMLHVSGGYLIKDNVKNSKLKILKNCNHVLQLDKPKEASRLLLEFLD